MEHRCETRGQLTTLIAEHVKSRGFYILIDDRIKLVCGPDCSLGNTSEHKQAIIGFAQEQGWFVDIQEEAIIFWASRAAKEKAHDP